jgi:hypothetical protein
LAFFSRDSNSNNKKEVDMHNQRLKNNFDVTPSKGH